LSGLNAVASLGLVAACNSFGQILQLELEAGDGLFKLAEPFLGGAGIGFVHRKQSYVRRRVQQDCGIEAAILN